MWQTSWRYRAIDNSDSPVLTKDLTQRAVIRNNLSGKAVRLFLTNVYGTGARTVKITAAAFRRPSEDIVRTVGKEDPGLVLAPVPVTVGGQTEIVLSAGETLVTDPVELALTPDTDLAVFLFWPGEQAQETCVSTSSSLLFVTEYLSGDHTGDPCFTPAAGRSYPRGACPARPETGDSEELPEGSFGESTLFSLCAVQVEPEVPSKIRTVCMFGDSITHMSFYSDALALRLYRDYPGTLAMTNLGIGGNRLLHDASAIPLPVGENGAMQDVVIKAFGPAGLSRFERDVYALENPTDILLMIGVNDFMHALQFGHPGEIITAEEMEEGIEAILSITKVRGSRLYATTVMPFGIKDAPDWYREADVARINFNSWLRVNRNRFAGLLDFDLALKDPFHPELMKDYFHVGDGLHPNPIGGALMAEIACETLSRA